MPHTTLYFENEAGFKTLFEHATLSIIVVDESGSIIVANPYTERLFGYKSVELIGAPVEMLMPHQHRDGHHDDRDRYFRDPKPREMGSGKALYALKKDGTRFPVEISLSYYELDTARVAVAFVTDITLQVLNKERLEQEVAQRTEQLEQLLHDEQSLNELKSRFIGIASHEFRTPLSTVLSSISLIERYIEKGDIAAQLKHTVRVKKAVQHLNTILTDFLSLEKLDEGMVHNQPEPTQVDVLVQEVVNDLNTVTKPGQSIHYDYQDTFHLVSVDPNLFKACVINLISNAIKYSGENKSIKVVLSLDEQVCLSVKDEGVGIPEEDQVRLFSRFFRASNVGDCKGTGLGLNIVKKYVEIMGGSIDFQSREGAGTTFQIKIPYD